MSDVDIVLVQSEHNDDYFQIIKSRDSAQDGYIHERNLASYVLGTEGVKLYNRDEIFRHEEQEWDVKTQELVDEMCGFNEEPEDVVNVVSRIEIDD